MFGGTVLVIIFWNFMFYYRSDSPQAKRNLLSSTTNLIYQLSPELPNKLRLSIIENQEILEKSRIWLETAQCPASPPGIRLWQQQSKNTQKFITNFSYPVQSYRISFRNCRFPLPLFTSRKIKHHYLSFTLIFRSICDSLLFSQIFY